MDRTSPHRIDCGPKRPRAEYSHEEEREAVRRRIEPRIEPVVSSREGSPRQESMPAAPPAQHFTAFATASCEPAPPPAQRSLCYTTEPQLFVLSLSDLCPQFLRRLNGLSSVHVGRLACASQHLRNQIETIRGNADEAERTMMLDTMTRYLWRQTAPGRDLQLQYLDLLRQAIEQHAVNQERGNFMYSHGFGNSMVPVAARHRQLRDALALAEQQQENYDRLAVSILASAFNIFRVAECAADIPFDLFSAALVASTGVETAVIQGDHGVETLVDVLCQKRSKLTIDLMPTLDSVEDAVALLERLVDWLHPDSFVQVRRLDLNQLDLALLERGLRQRFVQAMGNATSLKQLLLYQIDMTDLAKLLNSTQSLEELNLSVIKLDSRQDSSESNDEALVFSCNTTLRSLAVSDMLSGEVEIAPLINALPALDNLSLQNTVENSHTGLAAALRSHTTLRRLDIGCSPDVGPQSFRELVSGIAGSTTLQSLEIDIDCHSLLYELEQAVTGHPSLSHAIVRCVQLAEGPMPEGMVPVDSESENEGDDAARPDSIVPEHQP